MLARTEPTPTHGLPLGQAAPARGFTLIELMVAMALMVILMTILASFVASAQKIYETSTQQAEVIANARTALGIMARDINTMQATTAVSSIPIPGTEDIPLGLQLRSWGYLPENDWRGTSEYTNWTVPSGGYADLPPATPPTANEQEVRDAAFLQFFCTARYYDVNATPNPTFVQRPVLVQYYLRRRPQVDGFDMPGAFLMRRVQPYTVDPVTVTFNWETPVEDDICSFVRGVRVYYYDRAREVNGAANEDARWVEAINPGDPISQAAKPEAANPEMYVSTQGPAGAVTFVIDPQWQQPGTAAAFSKKDFNPPAIRIELLVCNSQGNVFREMQQGLPDPRCAGGHPRQPVRQLATPPTSPMA